MTHIVLKAYPCWYAFF